MSLRQIRILEWVSTFGIFWVAWPAITNLVVWAGMVVLVAANGIFNRRIGYRESTNDAYKNIDRSDVGKNMQAVAAILVKLQHNGNNSFSISYAEKGVDKELQVTLKDVEV